jgi:hypothetical protein
MLSFPIVQKLLTQVLKTGPAPQSERQVDIPEPKRARDTNAFEPHRNGQLLAAVVEKHCLPRLPD